jgi:two-component system, NtrC family, sensor kinase
MKVLVADDEAISRKLLSNYLQKWGHDVVVAENGAEAWKLFEEGEFRIVLSDWMMPEVDGLELIRRIRAHDTVGYVYVILLTAKAQKEDVVEGMEAGADDFVAKPFDRDELRVRLWEGERMIELHQALAERNRDLQGVQDALSESEQLLSTLRQEVRAALVDPEQRERLDRRFAQCMEALHPAVDPRPAE